MVIRHDVNPEKYLADEKEYPAVFQLLPAVGVATVIHQNWAITAAHCIYLLLRDDFEEQPFKVFVAGSENTIADIAYPPECDVLNELRLIYQNARRDGREVTSETFIERVFLKMNSLVGPNDIALLRFKNPIAHVRPLPFYEQKDEIGQKAIMLGWGAFSTGDKGIIEGEENYDGRFRYTENRISQIRNNMLAFEFDQPDSQEVLLLEGANGPGDSGGPMLFSTSEGLKIAGISSYSSYSTEEMDEEVRKGQRPIQAYDTIEHYTRISDHLDWLHDIIG